MINNRANQYTIPAFVSQFTANAAQTIESNVIPFPVLVEMFRADEQPVQVQCDSFLGCCDGCGTPTYASDAPRVVDGYISCPECLAEEKSWFVPAVELKKAA